MEPKIEDLQSIRRLKRGDVGGLECLIARYQEKALRAAFLITHNCFPGIAGVQCGDPPVN